MKKDKEKKKPDCNEVYKRYRPKSWDRVLGQDSVVAALTRMIERGTLPHALMLQGPSGCGKTTIARILKDALGCAEMDYHEVNCADMRGIDDVRNMRRQLQLMPMGGEVSMWLVDEAQKLTNDAQNAMLKLLEDTPPHVYFVFCTTDPQKLIATVKTRLTAFKLEPLTDSHLKELLHRVCSKEGLELGDKVRSLLIERSNGSARMLLVLLDRIMVEGDEDSRVEAIRGASFDDQAAYHLARAIWNRERWTVVAAQLVKMDKQDPEGLRYAILGYCNSILIGKNHPPKKEDCERAYFIIDVFSGNFYDSKFPGLCAACWEVLKV